jgi:hypothetical protein
MMAMMGCFALFSVEQRALILVPGNLAVALGFAASGFALARKLKWALPIGLATAFLTAGMGLLELGKVAPKQIQLPGAPFIWVVIGLYIAFRLVINHQHQRRAAERKASPLEDQDVNGDS